MMNIWSCHHVPMTKKVHLHPSPKSTFLVDSWKRALLAATSVSAGRLSPLKPVARTEEMASTEPYEDQVGDQMISDDAFMIYYI